MQKVAHLFVRIVALRDEVPLPIYFALERRDVRSRDVTDVHPAWEVHAGKLRRIRCSFPDERLAE